MPVLGPLGVPFPADDLEADRPRRARRGRDRPRAARAPRAARSRREASRGPLLRRPQRERRPEARGLRALPRSAPVPLRDGRRLARPARAGDGPRRATRLRRDDLPPGLRLRAAPDVPDARGAPREDGPRRVLRDGVRDGLRVRRLPRLRRADPRTAASRRSARRGLACRRPSSTGQDLMAVDLSVRRWAACASRTRSATASGTFGYGLEFAEFLDLASLGGDLRQGPLAPALPRQPAAAHLRDGRRDAQRDRPPERRRRRLPRREAPELHAPGRDGDRERLGRHRGGLRRRRREDRRGRAASPRSS